MLTCRSFLHVRQFSSVVGSTRDALPMKGRYQNWKQPVYCAPHVNPLEMGPDFSYADGRTIHVTSKIQLEYKQDQLRLAKRIVQLLNEVSKMEDAYKEAEDRRIAEAVQFDTLRPKAKGTRSIV